jgi:SAM-dependent methyltransferase
VTDPAGPTSDGRPGPVAGSRHPGSSSPFDTLAPDYDEQFSSSPLGKTLRAAVRRRIEPHLKPGGSVLELGCGTGVDALGLAEVGMKVVAVDASEGMVKIARDRCRAHGSSVRVEHGDIRYLDAVPGCVGPFDLVLSNFGVLNCVEDLDSIMGAIATRLAPGGTAVVVVMGRVVPWEWAWMLVSGRPGSAFRRLRPGGVEWRGMRILYHTTGTVRRAGRSAGLTVRRTAGLGALLPVTEAGPWIARHPRLLGALDRIERRFETLPPLPWLADHLLVEMARD